MDLFHFYLEVGDFVDADHSAFTVPLEHSFEIGENLLFLLIIALKLTAAAKDQGKWENMKHNLTRNQSVLHLCTLLYLSQDVFEVISVAHRLDNKTRKMYKITLITLSQMM